MRTVAQVFLAYFLMLVLVSVWRLSPVARVAPDVVALFGAYLGLTARGQLAPAALAAAVIGYLGDLLMGTPVGLQATSAALVCVLAHLVHRRMLVRGLLLTVLFALVTGIIAGLVGLALRAYFGLRPSGGAELWPLVATIVFTAVVGPMVFRLARAVDRRFVRLSHLQSPVFD